MTLSEVCIRRPVFTTMLILLPVVMGLYGYSRMGVDLMPNVEFPTITIDTRWPGANIDEMEIGVTKLIEEAVNTIAGVDELSSTTREGASNVRVQFVLEKDRDIAQQDVQGKINTILSRLPEGVETPIVDKFDVDAIPVLTLAVSGNRSLQELTELADKQIKETLSGLDGVGAVYVNGGENRAINVIIDPLKLESYNLSIEQVRQALATQNLELPSGRVEQGGRELVLRPMGRVANVKQFNDIVVKTVNDQPVRIRDLGDGDNTVQDTSEESRSLGRLWTLDGDPHPAVFMTVQKQSGTNTVQVIDRVKQRLNDVEDSMVEQGKSDIRLEIVRDQSRFINSSMNEVRKHLVLGAILVSLTILLFLRDWRTMIMASVAIPTSLVSCFIVMWAMGFTLNNVTMLALVLAIGIVIDDAVVVHENIFRWMEEKGLGAWDAALGATKEIALAVMATTFSLVVIFLPIAFMSGRVGRWFSSFGITAAGAIMFSLLVSFTMTPMLCSRFLKLSSKAKKAGKAHHSGGFYGWVVEGPYLLILRWSMRHRWLIVLATVVVTASIAPLPFGRWMSLGDADRAKRLESLNWPGLIVMVGNDFIPKDDQSEMEIGITTPEGWSLARTDEEVQRLERALSPLRSEGVIDTIVTTIGDTTARRGQGSVTRASVYVRVTDLLERGKNGKPRFSVFQVMGRMRGILRDFPDLRTAVQIPSGIGGGGRGGSDVDYNLVGPDISKLIEYSDAIAERLRVEPGFTDVDTSIAFRKPEMRINIDRDRAGDLGVSIQSISSALRTLVGGEIVTDYKDSEIGEQYDVWLRARPEFRNDPDVIANLTVPSARAGLVRLISVGTPEESRGPSQIERFARQRKISINANLVGKPTDVAVRDLLRIAGELKIPADYTLIPSGRIKTQNEANVAFLMAFLFSLVFMYMILAAQFESFTHPIAILMAVPTTVPFALMSLIFLGQPLTIFSILGLFLLFGIVKKNGILQIDYSNVLRRRAKEDPGVVPEAYRTGQIAGAGGWMRWMSRQTETKRIRLWATIEANRTRLRPILMTTLMLIASMVPIALGEGPGAANRAAMAKVIVGGQALSLLLSLLVTPVSYSLLDDLSLWRQTHREKEEAARKAALEPIPVETFK